MLRYDFAVITQLLVFLLLLVSLVCSASCLLATPAVGRWALLMNGATCLWNSDITVGFDADSLLQCTLFYSCTIIACAAEMSGVALVFVWRRAHVFKARRERGDVGDGGASRRESISSDWFGLSH